MKNRLQYLYSISVFIGVLSTAYFYLMVSSDRIKLSSTRTVQGPYLRTEAGIDPALSSLFEVEEVLESLPQDDFHSQKRVPTQATPLRKTAPKKNHFKAD